MKTVLVTFILANPGIGVVRLFNRGEGDNGTSESSHGRRVQHSRNSEASEGEVDEQKDVSDSDAKLFFSRPRISHSGGFPPPSAVV